MSRQSSSRQPVSRDKGPAAAFLGFGILLVAPTWAIARVGNHIDLRLAAAIAFLMSLAAALAHYLDKRRAEAGEWRVPETTLHLLELLGGWPGAFLAQRFLRHKVSKLSYQLVFWLIVCLYQAVAIDCVTGWRGARWVLARF